MRDPWGRARAQPWVGAIRLPSTRPAESSVHLADTVSVPWPSPTPVRRAGTTQTTDSPNVYVCASLLLVSVPTSAHYAAERVRPSAIPLARQVPDLLPDLEEEHHNRHVPTNLKCDDRQ